MKVWWSLAWRGILFGLVAGAITGFIVGFILGIAGKPELGGLYGQIAGMVVGIPIGIWVVKSVLTKEFRHYRIVLIPSDEVIMEQKLECKAL